MGTGMPNMATILGSTYGEFITSAEDCMRNSVIMSKINELEKKISNPNVFEILKITEIRHSNFLAWLLSPREKHGLKEKFAKEFFLKVKYQYDKEKVCTSGATTVGEFVDKINYTDCNVYREVLVVRSNIDRKKGYIDILIEYPNSKQVVVIENKTGSKEHDDQLEKYEEYVEENYIKKDPMRKYVEENYKDSKWEAMYIFLDSSNIKPSRPDWKLITYEPIVECVDYILENVVNCANVVNCDKVKIYLEDYKEVIKDNLIKNGDAQILSRQIFTKFPKFFDGLYKIYCAETKGIASIK